MNHLIEHFSDIIGAAARTGKPLRIRGGGSKDFYGNRPQGDLFDVSSYCGIVNYQPSELVLTARAGTRLQEIEQVLREQGQMLACEPPHYGPGATLGGMVAAGLSGPRRAYGGSVRDIVLGVRMLNGRGEDLRFGGEVMKNVAGYDVSRLMTGSLGTLGVLLEISLKVLPLPQRDITLVFEMNQADALQTMNLWAGKPLPLSATCQAGDRLYCRLSGAESAVQAAHAKLGGEVFEQSDAFWTEVREQTHEFFSGSEPLWRLSLNSSAPMLDCPGRQLLEWNGSLRWLKSAVDVDGIRHAAAAGGGHATLFRAQDKNAGVFHPLPPAMMQLHRRLKQAFDPHAIFNPQRMYREF